MPIKCRPTVYSSPIIFQEDWFTKEVSSQFLITDPAICLPGFDLDRKDWTLLNRFRTGHGQCAATLHDWGIRDNPLCACGTKQTMLHIVNECPLTKFPGGSRHSTLQMKTLVLGFASSAYARRRSSMIAWPSWFSLLRE